MRGLTIMQLFLSYWVCKSVVLFPDMDYLDQRDVRANRRKWVRAKQYLASR